MRSLRMFLVAIALLCCTPCFGKHSQYEARCFDCYLVGLCGVFDGDKMVSQPYGVGVFDDLRALAKKWNRRGIKIGDERKMQQSFKHKFRFSPTIGN